MSESSSAKTREELQCGVCNKYVRCDCPKNICPYLPVETCRWRGKLDKIYEHYQEKHKEYNFDENEFQINLTNCNEINYLSKFNNQIFLLHVNATLIEEKLYIGLRTLSNLLIPSEYLYDLDIYADNMTDDFNYKNLKLNRNYSILSREQLLPSILCKITIKQFSENENLKEDEALSSENIVETEDELSVFKEETNIVDNHMQILKYNKELFNNFECPICFQFMTPPIRQCVAGHSLCNNCTTRIVKCPICRADIGSARNFTLEAMISEYIKPCVNQEYGCNFIASILNIEKHEIDCDIGPTTCPLKEYVECNWKSKSELLLHHLNDNHNSNLLESDIARIRYNGNNYENCLIVQKFNKIFQICYKFEKEIFYLTTQVMENCEDDYIYTLCFKNVEENIDDTYYKGNCIANTLKCDLFQEKKFIRISLFMIRPYMKDDVISFKYSLNKVD